MHTRRIDGMGSGDGRVGGAGRYESILVRLLVALPLFFEESFVGEVVSRGWRCVEGNGRDYVLGLHLGCGNPCDVFDDGARENSTAFGLDEN